MSLAVGVDILCAAWGAVSRTSDKWLWEDARDFGIIHDGAGGADNLFIDKGAESGKACGTPLGEKTKQFTGPV